MLNQRELKTLEHQAIVAGLFWLCDPVRTMEDFKVGDTVQLKSGGPIMTVGTQTADGRIECAFFDGATLRHATFPPAQLKKVEVGGAGQKALNL